MTQIHTDEKNHGSSVNHGYRRKMVLLCLSKEVPKKGRPYTIENLPLGGVFPCIPINSHCRWNDAPAHPAANGPPSVLKQLEMRRERPCRGIDSGDAPPPRDDGGRGKTAPLHPLIGNGGIMVHPLIMGISGSDRI